MRRTSSSLLAFVLLAAGCSILPAPQASRDRFFTLTAMEGDAAGGSAAGPVYGIGPVRLPAYLDRNELVVRLSPTEIRYADSDRWAEPLRSNVARVLQQNLAALLGNPRVVVFPWPREVPVAYAVEVGFTRFETDAAGRAELGARWSIRDGRTARYLTLRETALTGSAPPGDTPAAVAALSGLLADLAHEIAADLRRMPASPGPDAPDAAGTASGPPGGAPPTGGSPPGRRR